MSDEPVKPPVTIEAIPSVQNGVSAIASANAPMIFFNSVSNFGVNHGVCHMTLLATRFMPTPSSNAGQDYIVAAHLRFDRPALEALKTAIAAIEDMISPPPPNKVN